MKAKREKEKKPSWGQRLRQAVSEMDVPVYAMFDVPCIELVGDGRLLIERHHGILEYSGECIRVAARDMSLCITGVNLQLQAMTQSEIAVTGRIASIEMQR